MEKHYLVVGAGGLIGFEVVRRLRAEGHHVHAMIRTRHRFAPLEGDSIKTKLENLGAVVDVLEDVGCRKIVEACFSRLCGIMFDGVIYAIRHCPQSLLVDAMQDSSPEFSGSKLLAQVDAHLLGALNVFQVFRPAIKDEGCFLFFSSAIASVNEDEGPVSFQADLRDAMVSALEWLIQSMRRAPAIEGRTVKVHRLAPMIMDTSPYSGGLQQTELISLSEAAAKAAVTMEGVPEVDELMV